MKSEGFEVIKNRFLHLFQWIWTAALHSSHCKTAIHLQIQFHCLCASQNRRSTGKLSSSPSSRCTPAKHDPQATTDLSFRRKIFASTLHQQKCDFQKLFSSLFFGYVITESSHRCGIPVEPWCTSRGCRGYSSFPPPCASFAVPTTEIQRIWDAAWSRCEYNSMNAKMQSLQMQDVGCIT